MLGHLSGVGASAAPEKSFSGASLVVLDAEVDISKHNIRHLCGKHGLSAEGVLKDIMAAAEVEVAEERALEQGDDEEALQAMMGGGSPAAEAITPVESTPIDTTSPEETLLGEDAAETTTSADVTTVAAPEAAEATTSEDVVADDLLNPTTVLSVEERSAIERDIKELNGQIGSLSERLEAAIEEEDFELAASLDEEMGALSEELQVKTDQLERAGGGSGDDGGDAAAAAPTDAGSGDGDLDGSSALPGGEESTATAAPEPAPVVDMFGGMSMNSIAFVEQEAALEDSTDNTFDDSAPTEDTTEAEAEAEAASESAPAPAPAVDMFGGMSMKSPEEASEVSPVEATADDTFNDSALVGESTATAAVEAAPVVDMFGGMSMKSPEEAAAAEVPDGSADDTVDDSAPVEDTTEVAAESAPAPASVVDMFGGMSMKSPEEASVVSPVDVTADDGNANDTFDDSAAPVEDVTSTATEPAPVVDMFGGMSMKAPEEDPKEATTTAAEAMPAPAEDLFGGMSLKTAGCDAAASETVTETTGEPL
jgi:hypothetical protein